MKPHAFVAMPFGTKPGHDGTPIDFNRVYEELLKPALEAAGCEAFRADEEQRAGDIRTDMFQELLVADLVLADLTLDNPNVWYELGVRHALRARGVVLVQGPRPSTPFDIYTDRKLRYSIRDGAPDPATLERDRAAIATMARETLAASTRRVVSPVYSLLPHLRQPQWEQLLVEGDNEFGAAYQVWRDRVEVARRKQRPGDILVLADESPTRALALEARREAAGSLMKLQRFDFALEQLDAALESAPDDPVCRRRRVICLGRLGRHEEAHEAAASLVEALPKDAEVLALAGRVEKDRWVARWRTAADGPDGWRAAAAADVEMVEEAIAPYQRGFVADPSSHYAGINALTLTVLHEHLGGQVARAVRDNLTGGVAWAALAAQQREPKDFWARASFAELALLVNAKESVQREYRNAAAVAQGDRFALESARGTVVLLRDLGFRPEESAAALEILDREIARSVPPFVPRQVLLFSGHMIDAPGRTPPRLPADKEGAAAARLAQALDAAGAGEGDLALSQAAAGGDLLFVEACQARGVRCQVLLPFDEPTFIAESLLPSVSGEAWRERWFAAKARLADAPRVMPVELGPLPRGVNPYERCNLWLLYSALAWGADRLRFFCLWNGSGGDGPGGTRHMHDEVKRRTGRVAWVDTRTL